VERGRELVIDTEVGPNSEPELTGKLFAVIGGDILWYTTVVDHVFGTHSCELGEVNVLSAEKFGRHLSPTVDDYHDPSVSRCH